MNREIHIYIQEKKVISIELVNIYLFLSCKGGRTLDPKVSLL